MSKTKPFESFPTNWITLRWNTVLRSADVQLNQSMGTISGPLKTTPLPSLPVLANIISLRIRQQITFQRHIKKSNNRHELLINEDI